MVLSSTQLQKVSVTLWFHRLQCLVLRSVLSVFINLRSADCVCSYYWLRVCSQTNKLKNIKEICKKMVKNQFFSKTTNTVRFTKKCSQEADIILVLLSILRPKWALLPKCVKSYVNLISFDLFVTSVTWLHGCCYGQQSRIGLKYVFSWFARN